jgi:hypothetical protein
MSQHVVDSTIHNLNKAFCAPSAIMGGREPSISLISRLPGSIRILSGLGIAKF